MNYKHPSSRIQYPLSRIEYLVSSIEYAKQSQFAKSQMNVSFFYTMDYDNKRDWTLGENKPNSNPIFQ